MLNFYFLDCHIASFDVGIDDYSFLLSLLNVECCFSLNVYNVYILTLLLLDSGEAKPAWRASECQEARPLLFLQHKLFPASSPWTQSGHKPPLRWQTERLELCAP